jgi:RNA polymerase sigma-70 factor, ECF subfamily
MQGEDLGETSDAELMARAGRGDREAFARLVSRHQASVFRFARALASSQPNAEDILQETFLAALKGAPGFRGDAPVRSWLFSIARHAAARQGRRHVGEPDRFESLEPLDTLGVEAGWGSEDPEALVIAAQHRAGVASALEALPGDDREVLILRDLEGLSGEETAAALGTSLASMKSRLHRARLRFAAALRQQGEAHA